jgi:hypothetical protein
MCGITLTPFALLHLNCHMYIGRPANIRPEGCPQPGGCSQPGELWFTDILMYILPAMPAGHNTYQYMYIVHI